MNGLRFRVMFSALLVATSCLLMLTCGVNSARGQGASSANFRIPNQTLNLSSGKSTSSSYVLRGCLGAGPEAAGSASSPSYHVQVGCPQALSAGLPADDDDGDGVTSGTENNAPNGGDGNGDGIADSLQPNVASLLGTGRGYITVVVPAENGPCSQLLNVHAVVPETLGGGDPNFSYPFGMVGFTLPCDGPVQVTVIFHGSTGLAALPTIYRKFGHEAPDFVAPPHFYTLPDVSFATLPVGTSGEVALQTTFTLTNGLIGDDTNASDHTIIDPGAPAGPPVPSVPVLPPGLLVILVALLSIVGGIGLRRKQV
jgi:hypothetical protein